MKYNYFLLVVIALCLVAFGLKVSKLNAENDRIHAVSVIDEYSNSLSNTNESGENLYDSEGRFISVSNKNSREVTQIIADGSKVNTMFDRYGNKTQTRCFNYDPRVNCVMLNISADGQRKVFVYAQNGDVKSLPENMLDKVTIASANEIADAAGIVLTPSRLTTTPYPQISKTVKTSPPAAPAPNLQPQIQNQVKEQVEPQATPEVKPTTVNLEKEVSSN
jgi:hypothetical protein